MDKILLVIGALWVFACNRSGTAVEGIYTTHSIGEYSRSYDTLIVYPIDLRQNTCLIRRRTAYFRTINGVEQAKQNKTEAMLTIYDPATERLTDPKTGRLFLFGKKELRFGAVIYAKQ